MSISNVVITNEVNKNSENKFTLAQSSRFYNPYGIVIKTKSFTINDIFFYDDNGVSLHTGRGWFGSSNEIHSITFKTKKPVTRKMKIDFSTKAPFIVKSDNSIDVNYNLYFYIPDLPKFDVSYLKTTLGIIKSVDFGLSDAKHNYAEQYVKYFLESYNADEELRVAIHKFDVYGLKNQTDEEFNFTIENIIKARKKLVEAIEYEKNYTVEDYLKEENITNS